MTDVPIGTIPPAHLPLETLIGSRFVERPRDLPLAAWTAVFDLPALASDGTPCSPEEFRQRFARFVAGKLAGRHGERVRISRVW
jgi:hypothetical protein